MIDLTLSMTTYWMVQTIIYVLFLFTSVCVFNLVALASREFVFSGASYGSKSDFRNKVETKIENWLDFPYEWMVNKFSDHEDTQITLVICVCLITFIYFLISGIIFIDETDGEIEYIQFMLNNQHQAAAWCAEWLSIPVGVLAVVFGIRLFFTKFIDGLEKVSKVYTKIENITDES